MKTINFFFIYRVHWKIPEKTESIEKPSYFNAPGFPLAFLATVICLFRYKIYSILSYFYPYHALHMGCLWEHVLTLLNSFLLDTAESMYNLSVNLIIHQNLKIGILAIEKVIYKAKNSQD